MATIDISKPQEDVGEIVFARPSDCNRLVKCAGPYIKFCDQTDDYLLVHNSDVPNLIKALQKAVELGWTK